MRTLTVFLFSLASAAAQPDSRPGTSSRPVAAHGTLVVLNKNDATAWFVDARSGERLHEAAVGVGPHEAAASPDGAFVAVCNYGDQTTIGSSLTILDVATGAVRTTIDLAPWRRPHGIQFTKDGKLLITAETDQKLLVVDVESKTVVATVPTKARLSHMVVAEQDGSRAYVANIGSGSVSVLDLEKRECVGEVRTDKGCEGLALRPGTKELWTTNRAADTVSVVATDTLKEAARIECGKFPLRVAFTPDGKRALVACTESDVVAVLDATTRKVVTRIALEADAKPAGILVTPDGSRAYVALMARGEIAEIDLGTLRVVRALKTGTVPDGMAWIER